MTETATTASSLFKLEVNNGFAHIRFARPEKANSMSREFWREFPQTVSALNQQDDVRVLLISGEGKNFSSGMDLSVFSDSSILDTKDARNRERLINLIVDLQRCFSVLESCHFPVIAAINGACVGAALDLIAACDIRYASESAFFSIHEINLAMMADLGSLQRLPRLMPEGLVRELAFTGDKLTAPMALKAGLVNRVFKNESDLLNHAIEQAKKIATKSPLAISMSKKLLNFSRSHSVEDSLDYCASLQAAILEPADILAAAKAQGAKSEAKFKALLPKNVM